MTAWGLSAGRQASASSNLPAGRQACLPQAGPCLSAIKFPC